MVWNGILPPTYDSYLYACEVVIIIKDEYPRHIGVTPP